MSVAPLLSLAPGVYRGLVTGEESGTCSARIVVRRVPGGCLAVDYEATSQRHGLQHAEHTVVTEDALFVAFSEGAGVARFAQREPGVYVHDDPVLPLEIHASATPDGGLVWAWHWAPDGEPPREQSRAVCRLADPWSPDAPS